jgi:hypothetical protein
MMCCFTQIVFELAKPKLLGQAHDLRVFTVLGETAKKSGVKPGVRRTARRIKRFKEAVLTISTDYSDRPTPDFLALSTFSPSSPKAVSPSSFF